MDSLHLNRLAEKLNLTNLDAEPEPYVLTPEEEERVIENEIASLKKYAAWRMFDKKLSEQEIALRLSEVDWCKQIDRKEILSRANSSKNYDLWQKAQHHCCEKGHIESICRWHSHCSLLLFPMRCCHSFRAGKRSSGNQPYRYRDPACIDN